MVPEIFRDRLVWQLIRTILVLFIASLGSVATMAAPTDWQQASYLDVTQREVVLDVDLAFTSRAPPPSGTNLAITGAHVHGADGLRALPRLASLGDVPAFLRSSIAPNRVELDANVTWKRRSSDTLGPNGLPVYDGKNTLGTLDVGGETYYVKNGQGQPGLSLYNDPNIKAGAVSHSHAEGHAAAIIRKTGVDSGTITINNPNGPCGFCDKVIENMLPEGASLTVNWPNGSHTFIGNAK